MFFQSDPVRSQSDRLTDFKDLKKMNTTIYLHLVMQELMKIDQN